MGHFDASTAAALRRVANDGADMSRPMVIDFHVAFLSLDAGMEFVRIASRAGFIARLVEDSGGERPEWTCWCSREMLATHDEITSTEDLLGSLARPLGGYCDGWGTFGNGNK